MCRLRPCTCWFPGPIAEALARRRRAVSIVSSCALLFLLAILGGGLPAGVQGAQAKSTLKPEQPIDTADHVPIESLATARLAEVHQRISRHNRRLLQSSPTCFYTNPQAFENNTGGVTFSQTLGGAQSCAEWKDLNVTITDSFLDEMTQVLYTVPVTYSGSFVQFNNYDCAELLSAGGSPILGNAQDSLFTELAKTADKPYTKTRFFDPDFACAQSGGSLPVNNLRTGLWCRFRLQKTELANITWGGQPSCCDGSDLQGCVVTQLPFYRSNITSSAAALSTPPDFNSAPSPSPFNSFFPSPFGFPSPPSPDPFARSPSPNPFAWAPPPPSPNPFARPPPPPGPPSSSSSSGSSSSIGPIIGAVVGGIAAVVVIGGLTWWWCRRRKAKKAAEALKTGFSDHAFAPPSSTSDIKPPPSKYFSTPPPTGVAVIQLSNNPVANKTPGFSSDAYLPIGADNGAYPSGPIFKPSPSLGPLSNAYRSITSTAASSQLRTLPEAEAMNDTNIEPGDGGARGAPAVGSFLAGSGPSGSLPPLALADHLRIHYKDMEDIEEIGQGGFSFVYSCNWKGHKVVLKMVRPELANDRQRNTLIREALLMRELQHPAVARVYGVVDEPPHHALVMQHYKRGTLEDFMCQSSTQDMYEALTPLDRLRMAGQVADGMAFLHACSPAIVHGDLKAANILVDEDNRVVITDFGLAVQLMAGTGSGPAGRAASYPDSLRGLLGSAPPSPAPSSGSSLFSTLWTSPTSALSVFISPPEVLAFPQAPRQPSSDVYAFGITLLQIMTGRVPYRNMNADMVIRAVCQGRRPSIPEDVPESVSQLIQECWAQEWAARPHFTQVAQRIKAEITQLRDN